MLQSVITVTPMLVCLFWTFVLLVDLKEHGDRGAHKQLLAWSLAATLLYMGHCAFFNKDFSALPFFDALYVACNLSVFPLYLRYLTKLTEGRVGAWMNWGVALPPVAFGLVVAQLYLLMSEKDTQSFVHHYLYHNSFDSLEGLARLQAVVHQTAKVVFAIGVCTTLTMGLRKIRRYNRLVESIYADTEDKRLHSIGTLLLLLVLMSCISFVANAIGKHVFVDSNWMLGPTFLIFSVLLFALSYAGYRQVFSFEDIEQVETEAPAYIGNGLSDDIRKLMEKERIYLTHNLKVGDIATRLNTNSRYIQEALNVEMNVNFQRLYQSTARRLRGGFAQEGAGHHDGRLDSAVRLLFFQHFLPQLQTHKRLSAEGRRQAIKIAPAHQHASRGNFFMSKQRLYATQRKVRTSQ